MTSCSVNLERRTLQVESQQVLKEAKDAADRLAVMISAAFSDLAVPDSQSQTALTNLRSSFAQVQRTIKSHNLDVSRSSFVAKTMLEALTKAAFTPPSPLMGWPRFRPLWPSSMPVLNGSRGTIQMSTNHIRDMECDLVRSPNDTWVFQRGGAQLTEPLLPQRGARVRR